MIRTLIHACGCRWFRSIAPGLLLAFLLLPSLSGCAIAVQIFGAANPQIEAAKYRHLSNQSVAVMVWAEENGVRVEWPRIHLDLAQMIQSKLLKSQKEDKPDELKETRFPVSPASVAKYQEEHPETVGIPAEEIAPKLGVSRVIYVEIHVFQTRPDQANDLFRGTVTGSLHVIEVTNGKGRETFVDDNIRVTFPRSSPEEGLPTVGDFAIYNGSLDGFATEITKRFVPHGNDQDAAYGTGAPPAQ